MSASCLQTGNPSLDMQDILQSILASRELQAKRDILSGAAASFSLAGDSDLYAQPGDDCAAFAVGDGYQLLAIEGMLPGFVASDPFHAGWSAVMANVSDIAAMGGRPTAIVNAYWHHDEQEAAALLKGIRKACEFFGVQFSGGHTSIAPETSPGLAVAIIGYARTLLSCHHVEPGQAICMISDLNGSWHGDKPYWATLGDKSPQQVRANWDLLPQLAEQGLVRAAKDISNGGLIGTLLMMLELKQLGAVIDLNTIPRPYDCDDLGRWLKAFQSYGFIITCDEQNRQDIIDQFSEHDLSCEQIGRVSEDPRLIMQDVDSTFSLWDFTEQSLTGFGIGQEQG